MTTLVERADAPPSPFVPPAGEPAHDPVLEHARSGSTTGTMADHQRGGDDRPGKANSPW